MSFIDAQTDTASRARALAAVGGIHALIAAGVIAGLAVTVAIEKPTRKPIVEWTDDKVVIPPPPPPDDVTTPPETANDSQPVAPIPRTNLTQAETQEVVVFDGRDIPTSVSRGPDNLLIPTPPLPVPRPAPSFSPKSASPTNGPAGWITNDDYPGPELRRGREGTAGYRLVIGSNGRVNDCEITRSSGSNGLDRATCRLIERRARFDPAMNAQGERSVGTYSGSVTWEIPN